MANAIRKSLSFKKNVEPEVLEFLDKQSNYSDSILYLIQKEIAEHGVRDMQLYIPSRRSIESIREMNGMVEVVTSNTSAKKEEKNLNNQLTRVDKQQVSTMQSIVENKNYAAFSEDELKNKSFQNINVEVPVDEHPVQVVEEKFEENVPSMKNEVVNEVQNETENVEDEYSEYFN